MTYHRSQAHRTLRIPAWYIGLALLIVSAGLVVLVIWLALALLTSMQQYISVLP